MDHALLVQSTVSYVEARVRSPGACRGLERSMGISYPHLREVFKSRTGISLGRYLLYRRVSYAAFELAHTGKPLIDIAMDYGFENPDTFTRAFSRFAGMRPSDFRKARVRVGRVKLTGGAYGPGLGPAGADRFLPLEPEVGMKEAKKIEGEGGCVLYGVPRVHYRREECTPFPSALRACLNYMGQDIRYGRLMAACGASFRLLWRKGAWDGGNVDVMGIFDRPEEAVERAMSAAGRDFSILRRTTATEKGDFVRFIRAEIDAGRPVVAFGIIGPPEACIVAGYRDGGETLLGWNFFQDNPEFAAAAGTDDSGYFVCSSWWENPDTIMLLSIGEAAAPGTPDREMLARGLAILRRDSVGGRASGLAAFDAWAEDLSEGSFFPDGAPLPLLFERLMCQNDAVTMLGEGRAYASCFLQDVKESLAADPVAREASEAAGKAAAIFHEEMKIAEKIARLAGGWTGGVDQARKLAEPAVRAAIVPLIRKAKALEAEAAAEIEAVLAFGG